MWHVEFGAANKRKQCKWHAAECRVTLSTTATKSSSETILPISQVLKLLFMGYFSHCSTARCYN